MSVRAALGRGASARLALAGFAWLTACAPGGRDAAGADPAADAESVARSLLTARLFAPLAELEPLFAPDRPPGGFPLRMMAAGPEDLEGARLDRLRMIDGRAVVTARARLDGVAQHFEFWMERHEGAWRVAGWSPTPTPLASPDAPVPDPPPDPPAELLGPFFRAAHPVLALPLVTEAGATGAAGAAVAEAAGVGVHVKTPIVTGACRPAEVAAAVEHTVAGLSTCYRRALAGAPPRQGRITWQLQYTAEAPAPQVALVESTLLLAGLPECLEAALGGARLAGRACRATVPLVFTPVAPKAPAAGP